VVSRACNAIRDGGGPCNAAPLRDRDFCLWHDPEHADVVAEARKVGGGRKRKEATIAVAYDFDGLATAEQIRRLVEIAVVDALGLENSIARARTLAYLAQTAAKLLELSDLEVRLREVEATLEPRLHPVRR
jgi:hypothetical protein